VIEVKNLLDDLICEYHVEDEAGNPATASLNGNGDHFLSSISARVASRRATCMGFRSELTCIQRISLSWIGGRWLELDFQP